MTSNRRKGQLVRSSLKARGDVVSVHVHVQRFAWQTSCEHGTNEWKTMKGFVSRCGGRKGQAHGQRSHTCTEVLPTCSPIV